MNWETMGLLAASGVAAGVANALAGGGTLITFPAMLAAGLPPITANASNAVAVTPGHCIAALVDRHKIPPFNGLLAAQVATAAIGGAVGAGLLLITPGSLFTALVPPLIAFATASFAFSGRIQATVGRWRKSALAARADLVKTAVLAPAAIYGGYFGAGLGVMLMAVLTLTGTDEVRVATAMKNVLATAVSVPTVMTFIASGSIRWPETLVVLCGALIGGTLGGRLLRVLPARIVRIAIIAVGVAMTIVYALRYW